MTWQLLSAGDPRIAAAVPFYGPLPDGADFSGSPNGGGARRSTPGSTTRVNSTQEAAAAALEAAGLDHELRTFDGVDHAFFNDTGRNYDADAAAAAYEAMLDWFDHHLAASTSPAYYGNGSVRSRCECDTLAGCSVARPLDRSP